MSIWQSFMRALNAEDEEIKKRDKKLDNLFEEADSVINQISIDLRRSKKKAHGKRDYSSHELREVG